MQALTPRAHAIECRIYAEDPDLGFMPSPGLVRALSVPGGPGVRDDRGVVPGFEIPVFYDSMISKLIVSGASRPQAIERLGRVLVEYRVVGVKTTLPFFRWLLTQPEFVESRVSTQYLDKLLAERKGTRSCADAGERRGRDDRRGALDVAARASIGGRRRQRRERRRRVAARGAHRWAAMTFEVEINGTLRRVSIEALGSAGPDGGRFRVVIDQKPIDVDARPTDLGLSLIVGDARRSVDVGGHRARRRREVRAAAARRRRRHRRRPAVPARPRRGGGG
jgi:acetyl/propionyl-CoA carboxylase alpha subunit